LLTCNQIIDDVEVFRIRMGSRAEQRDQFLDGESGRLCRRYFSNGPAAPFDKEGFATVANAIQNV
jgi:hypothetical protein